MSSISITLILALPLSLIFRIIFLFVFRTDLAGTVAAGRLRLADRISIPTVVSSFRAVFVVLGLITLSYRVIITTIVNPIIAAVAAISFLRMIDGICVSVAGIF